MKHLLIIMALFFSSALLVAQEEYHEEYRIRLGDTIIWHPFNQCNNISFKVSSKDIVQFEPILYGKVRVIGTKVGLCHLKATCGETSVSADITVEDTPQPVNSTAEKMEKPATQPFNGTYQFNPPTDHFFITATNPNDEYRETYAKIGSEEAYNNGHGIDRFWNTETGANYYYVPEAQGWTDDVKFDFEPFGESFFPLNAFVHEVDTDGDLSAYFIGTEKVLDIDCWVFFVEQDSSNVIRYWVDPANGCTLRRQVNNDQPSEVTVYDLQYTRWYFGPKYKKSLHDKTR